MPYNVPQVGECNYGFETLKNNTMETKKEAFKKFVIEQLKDFDYWGEAPPEGYAETIVDEAVKLFCQPDVVGRSEQFYCTCSRAKGLD